MNYKSIDLKLLENSVENTGFVLYEGFERSEKNGVLHRIKHYFIGENKPLKKLKNKALSKVVEAKNLGVCDVQIDGNQHPFVSFNLHKNSEEHKSDVCKIAEYFIDDGSNGVKVYTENENIKEAILEFFNF